MTNENLNSLNRRPKWRVGELSIGSHSHEDLLALAQSFLQTEIFLDAVEDILKRVDVVFGLRPASAEAIQAFLEPPPPKDQVSIITNKLTAVYLTWRLASDWNPAVAAFKGDTLEDLRNEIHRVNRDAINAVRNGTELQKVAAAYKSRKDITDAFYRMNRELGIHRAKYDLLHRVSDKGGFEHDGTDAGPSVEDNSSQAKKADANPVQPVAEKWLSPRSVAELAKETGCSRTTINDEVRTGQIPGGAFRENNKPRGNVILQQTGLDYLKRKSGKDK